MKFLKNRFVAKFLLLATIFGITPFIADGQLEDKVWEVQSAIYDYRGVYDRLEESNDAAGNLVSIALDYPTLVTDDDDLDDMYEANVELASAFHALYEKLSDVDLSDEDRRAVEAYINTFNGAQRTLKAAADDYNGQVRSFRGRTMGQFPANVIVDLFDIDAPEYFAADDAFSEAADQRAMTVIPDVPEAPKVPDVPDAPDAPDLDQTINDFVDGITDYVNHTVSDALDDAFND